MATVPAAPFFVYHVANAYEVGGDTDELVIDLVAFADERAVTGLTLENLRSDDVDLPAGDLVRYRLPLDGGESARATRAPLLSGPVEVRPPPQLGLFSPSNETAVTLQSSEQYFRSCSLWNVSSQAAHVRFGRSSSCAALWWTPSPRVESNVSPQVGHRSVIPAVASASLKRIRCRAEMKLFAERTNETRISRCFRVISSIR